MDTPRPSPRTNRTRQTGEYARLAFELAAARRGAPPPFLSLDAYAWAPRYALAAVPRWWERAGPLAFEELVAHRWRRGAGQRAYRGWDDYPA